MKNNKTQKKDINKKATNKKELIEQKLEENSEAMLRHKKEKGIIAFFPIWCITALGVMIFSPELGFLAGNLSAIFYTAAMGGFIGDMLYNIFASYRMEGNRIKAERENLEQANEINKDNYKEIFIGYTAKKEHLDKNIANGRKDVMESKIADRMFTPIIGLLGVVGMSYGVLFSILSCAIVAGKIFHSQYFTLRQKRELEKNLIALNNLENNYEIALFAEAEADEYEKKLESEVDSTEDTPVKGKKYSKQDIDAVTRYVEGLDNPSEIDINKVNKKLNQI